MRCRFAVCLVLFVPLWGLCLFLLYKAIDFGRTCGCVAVAGTELLVLHVGLLGTQQYTWQRQDLKAVRAGLGDFDFMQLLIIPRQGKRVGVFVGRHEAELWWLATLVRDALQLPAYARKAGGSQSPASELGDG